MPQIMLEVKNLVKRYGDFSAVDDLSFEVYQGDVFGPLGPNGAGKTTTIRTIVDILKPDAGTVSVLGQPHGAARSRIGYLSEERGLYRDLKVLDVLIYLAELKGTPRATAHQRALTWLERVELVDWAERKVKDLFANPNMPLVRVLSWFPLTAPTMVMLRTPMTKVPTIDVVGSIGMILITIPLILWAGAKVFRMGLLMYGKRPTLVQVMRSLREA